MPRADLAKAAGGDERAQIPVDLGFAHAHGQLQFKATDRTALGGQLDDVIEVLLMLGDQSLSALASQAFLICRQPGLEQSR